MRKFYIIVFLFLCVIIYAQKDYKVLSSSKNSLIVEYTPNYLEHKENVLNGEKYLDVEFLYGIEHSNNEIGIPLLSKRVLSIGVPQEFGNTITVLSSNFETIDGQIKPKPNYKKENDFNVADFQKSELYSTFVNPELVEFGDFGLVRDLRVQDISIHPVQFNPRLNQIKIYNRIVFQINFAPQSKSKSIIKSDLTNDLVINQSIARQWGVDKSDFKKVNTNSVLANGEWYRFEAAEEGIYRINRSFLSELGIDVASIDPRTIKIYNNGGYVLNWTPSADRPNDLVENSIIVNGQSDGSFDNADYILFYGRGVDFWEYDNITNRVERNKHFYSKKNYYWLTYGGEAGKRMEVQNNVNETPTITQTTTKAYRFRDNDNQNLIGSGLLYVDDDYSTSSQSKTYTHMLDGRKDGTTINYSFNFVNGSKTSNLLKIEENGTQIYLRTLSGPSSQWIDYRYGRLASGSTSYSNSIPDNRSVLKFTFSPSNISDKGHLDFLEIEYEQDLFSKTDNLPVIIFSSPVDAVVGYSGSPYNSSNFKIYNVTDYSSPKIINFSPNGGDFNFTTFESSGLISKYFAIEDDQIKVPLNAAKIENSNIRGNSPGEKYIVITHKNFEEQANRLVEYRTNQAQFKISGKVILLQDIYNEFSGGSLDPTAIRDFIMFAFNNWEIKPEYILLFGDGDYDYFDLLGKGLNFIPTFQTTESLYEIDSYPHDDYYSRISGDDKRADIAVGRLNVTTIDEAKTVVDKIISYESDLSKGLWRNKITLLGDDGLTSERDDGNTHTRQSEILSEFEIPENFDRNKIYLSNYQTINTGLGRRKPDCNTAIINSINNGTLIFNYYGHGNPDVWAHERVFERSTSIPQLKNKELFFLTAATCDFGKYDDPNLQSATEEMILMENGGMIGGISAVRPVFSGSNHSLNKTFYGYMLRSKDSLGLPLPIGKAYMNMKYVRTGQNDEKFHLFADPFLRLNIPKLPVEITSINDANISDTVNIKALEQVNIKGTVHNLSSSSNSYDGEGIITVFDSERTIYLEDINLDMKDQGGVIFRGRVSVEDGKFATSFTVPKDISYENKNGKIIAYFFNDEIDGVGVSNNIIVGGTDSSNVNDGEGPEIEILYDDETESSYLVSPNFKLRVKLFDDTGLNTTGTGIGHKLEAILNDDEQNSIDLTNFFVGDLNSGGKSGEVNYNFSSLEPGEYKIQVNAWDVFNNFASQENYFTVVDDNELVVREVYNYPNPFSSNTYFTFQHNLTDPLNVKIRVYTIAGRVIKELESFNIEDKFVKIPWNGKDDDNNKIGNGTYFYKLIVETNDGEYKENILGKMAVIR